MRRNAAWAVLLLLLTRGGAVGQHAEHDDVEVIQPPKVRPADDEKKPDLAAAVKLILTRTNAFRKEEGRAEVAVSAELARAAEYFAGYMAKEDRYGHTADGQRPADRAKKHGYEYCIVLENIAYQYSSAGFTTEELGRGFFEGWKHSPGHRKNMLDPDVTQTGVAVARSEKTGHYYAVQMFGRPRSQAVAFTITNRGGEAVKYAIAGQEFTLPPRYSRTHTRCRPEEVTFRPPGGDEVQKVKPAAGDRFVVTKGDDGLRVTKE
jgi:uncharacterized protein YkwD